jgi:hypothetical protein
MTMVLAETEQLKFCGEIKSNISPLRGRVIAELFIEWKVKGRETGLASRKAVLTISGS